MKLAIFAALTLLSITSQAVVDLNGTWEGKGVYDSNMETKKYDTEVSLTFNQTESEVTISDCWSYFSDSGLKFSFCDAIRYTIEGDQLKLINVEGRVGKITENSIEINFKADSLVVAIKAQKNEDGTVDYSFYNGQETSPGQVLYVENTAKSLKKAAWNALTQ